MQEKKHEVIVNGIPKIENMSKDTIQIFCKTVLGEIEAYYQHIESNYSDIQNSCNV